MKACLGTTGHMSHWVQVALKWSNKGIKLSPERTKLSQPDLPIVASRKSPQLCYKWKWFQTPVGLCAVEKESCCWWRHKLPRFRYSFSELLQDVWCGGEGGEGGGALSEQSGEEERGWRGRGGGLMLEYKNQVIHSNVPTIWISWLFPSCLPNWP